MKCASLIEKIGFQCREVSDNIVNVVTPLSFLDGELASFYVIEEGNSNVLITDNFDTIAYLKGRGLPLSDRRRWRSLSNRAENLGFTLSEEGELMAYGNVDDIPRLVARFLRVISEFVDWEMEQESWEPDTGALIDEIEEHLHRRNPNSSIKRDVTVNGKSGYRHSFDLIAGNTLVDASMPSSRSTGPKLRKFLDVGYGPEQEYRTMLVIDDRDDPEKARHEIQIVSNVARAMTFSHLATDEGPLDLDSIPVFK